MTPAQSVTSPNYWQTCPQCGGQVHAPRQTAYNPLRFRECGTCNFVYLPRAYRKPAPRKHNLRQVFVSTIPTDSFRGEVSVVVSRYHDTADNDPCRTGHYMPTKASLKRLERVLKRLSASVYLDSIIGVSAVYYVDGAVK